MGRFATLRLIVIESVAATTRASTQLQGLMAKAVARRGYMRE